MNKAKAYIKVRDILSNSPDDLELQSLMLYFAPNVPAMPKDPISWVKKALAKHDVREYLSYLYVDANGWLNATDGHRMHRTKYHDLEEGFYHPKTMDRLEDTDWKYPDTQKIADRVGDEYNPLNTDPLSIDCDIHRNYYYHFDIEDEFLKINKKYADDAMMLNCIEALAGDRKATVFVKNNFGEAYVMPVRH